ncbi:MAG: type III secretion protein [Anaeromyxobacter sp. RBG_16_69_14]|nr:MAG: type III secretion protein [Anaeromyxobacter sp. RBG_16_69_14]
MSGNRTEQPTPRRVREARRRGEIAVSRELSGAASLLAGLAALAATAPSTGRTLAAGVRAGLAEAVGPGAEPWPALVHALALLALAALPACGAAALGAAVAGSLQARGLFSLDAVRFRLDRLHLGKGLARLASAERLVATALGLLKAAAVLLVAWNVVADAAPAVAAAPRLDPPAVLRLTSALALRVALSLAALLSAFGGLDLALARRRHRKGLMMTREEVVRERREDEGDPRLKAERRRLHRALATAVPVHRATCLVVNPTHIAVALHHAKHDENAPVVVAKGVGEAAARLRGEARRAGVPVVHDVALARALFRLAEVGDEIPEELYEAAAAVLVHVHALAAEAAP